MPFRKYVYIILRSKSTLWWTITDGPPGCSPFRQKKSLPTHLLTHGNNLYKQIGPKYVEVSSGPLDVWFTWKVLFFLHNIFAYWRESEIPPKIHMKIHHPENFKLVTQLIDVFRFPGKRSGLLQNVPAGYWRESEIPALIFSLYQSVTSTQNPVFTTAFYFPLFWYFDIF